MKIKTLLLSGILSVALLPLLNAQGLIIKMQDGTENQLLISSVRKLSFSNDQLVMTPKSGSPAFYYLNGIQKLYFGAITSVNEKIPTGGSLSVYPNPAGEKITLLNMPEGTGIVRIFSLNGRLAEQATPTPDDPVIDISTLHSGIYFLVADGQTTKFIKL